MTAHSVLNVRAAPEWGNSELYKYYERNGLDYGTVQLSRELQVKLETLRFYPAWDSKGKEASVLSQQQTATTVKRPASIILRPSSTIPSASRPNSALGIQQLREVSTRFSQHHVVPMHNSTAEDGKQGHTISLITPRAEDIDITDMEVAEIVEVATLMTDTSD